jgi:transmembrane sensor
MDVQQFHEILRRYEAGACSPAEIALVDKWYEELINTADFSWDQEEKARRHADLQNRLLQSITNNAPLPLSSGRVLFMQRRFWWAAAVFIVLAGGAYFFLVNKPKKETSVVKTNTPKQNDVAPGGNKAVLTLANGTTINLNNAANGTLASEGNSVVNKTKDGELVYESAIPDKSGQAGNRQSAIIAYNILSTPKGGQYQLVLPDGSKVWLNAASSITYPTAFTGNQRKVQITGEVYFEVVHNSKMPFIVEKGNMAVEVLGTHFNINAYDDEGVLRTTLLEGKVKVSNQSAIGNRQSAIVNRQSAILKPGEQAVISLPTSREGRGEALTIDHSPDLEDVMAWKNGLFHFENADIKTVMRQLSRWYDVDIDYKSAATKNDSLFVEMSRNANLSDVLKALEVSTSVRFSIEGKKIIVQEN